MHPGYNTVPRRAFKKLSLGALYFILAKLVVCGLNKNVALMTLAHDLIKMCALFPSNFNPSNCKNDITNQFIDVNNINEIKNRVFGYMYKNTLKPLANQNRSILQNVKRDKDLDKYAGSFKIPSGFDTNQIANLKSGKPINSHEFVYLLECLTGEKMVVPENHRSCGTDIFDKIVEIILSF